MVCNFTVFLISNFHRVVNVVCFFLLGNSPASEFCMPTIRNTLFHLHRQVGMKNYSSKKHKILQYLQRYRALIYTYSQIYVEFKIS
jgi:hypothetical protein